jgi:hypothetical protein
MNRTNFAHRVARQSPDWWASKIEHMPVQMRAWAASLIWWSYIQPVSRRSKLFIYMDEYDYMQDCIPKEEFDTALKTIGLFLPHTPNGYEGKARPLIQNRNEPKRK